MPYNHAALAQRALQFSSGCASLGGCVLWQLVRAARPPDDRHHVQILLQNESSISHHVPVSHVLFV